MNRNLMKLIRAVLGLVILGALIVVVQGWLREYRTAEPYSAAETTATVTTTSTPEGDTATKGSGDKPAEKSPADATSPKADVVVVLIDALNLRSEATAGGHTIRGLNKNEKLTLLKKKGEWYQVRTSTGDEGWISANPSYSRVEKR